MLKFSEEKRNPVSNRYRVSETWLQFNTAQLKIVEAPEIRSLEESGFLDLSEFLTELYCGMEMSNQSILYTEPTNKLVMYSTSHLYFKIYILFMTDLT